MKPLNYPLIGLVLLFLAGLVSGFYLELSLRESGIVLAGACVLFLAAYFLSKSVSRNLFFSFSAFLLFFVFGVFVVKLHSPQNNPEHYLHYVNSKTSDEFLVVGKVVKGLNPGRFSDKYIMEIKRLDSSLVDGKVLLNMDKTPLSSILEVDDKVVLKTALVSINSPRNPHQFDYSEFMENQGVFRQVYVSPKEILVFKNSRLSFLGYAEKARNTIVTALRENGFSKHQLAIMQGLMLGQTEDISDKTYDDYAAAGVIHILSVSGLHVGFMLLIFDFLLKPLEFNRYGKIVKVVLLIILLWGFALLAGFSSPVVRSVSMFSLVAIGLNWERKTNLINILFMSLFVILLFAPRFIFEIGFQLSYLAVFAIVALQPMFLKLYASQNIVVKYVLGLITVSIAAQIGVTALSLYYFHQFPGISIFSNIVVIPATGIIMGLGLLVMVLALLKILPPFLTDAMGWSLDTLDKFVAWCANQEEFLFQNISFSFWEMMVAYLFVFCLILAVWRVNFKRIATCLVALGLFLGISLYQEKEVFYSKEFLIFHKNRKSMLGFKNGKNLMVLHNLSEKNIAEEYSIRNYLVGERIDEILSDTLKNSYKVDDGFLLVVDSLGVYNLEGLQNPLVLLRDSPQINLERLIENLNPKIIIADGSNYHSYVRRWRETCIKTGTPFHWTKEDGAFLVEY